MSSTISTIRGSRSVRTGRASTCYEIDPVHPLRRLSAWVRGRLAA